MPTYDYACQACGHTFERFQEMSAPKLKTCPACRKRRLVRLVGSGAGIIFKGSGFYETDYKRAGTRGGEGGDKTGGDAKPSGGPASGASGGDASSSPASPGAGRGRGKAGPDA